MSLWDQSQTSIMETGTSPRELFWVSGTGPREQSGLRIIVSAFHFFIHIINKMNNVHASLKLIDAYFSVSRLNAQRKNNYALKLTHDILINF